MSDDRERPGDLEASEESDASSPSEPGAKRGSEHVYEALLEAGIELLVGLPGTQTLPLDRTVAAREEMRYVMARHETAIPHVAWGYYETSGTVAATLTVPGPGETNAMHGLKNALEDGVPLVHLSADADPEERGRKPIHEIDPSTYDTVCKDNVVVERPLALPTAVARGIETALTPPCGPVRLGVPSGFLDREIDAPGASVEPGRTRYENARGYERAIGLLAGAERPVVYAGGGTRRTTDGPRVVADLAAALDAPVLASHKGKGVFPEDDRRFLGVTGAHTPASVRRVLDRADVVCALGVDFDGVTTSHWALPMGERLIHVDRDPTVFDRSYEADVAIAADATAAGERLAAGVRAERERGTPAGWDGEAVATEAREEYADALDERGLFDSGPPLPTPAALRAVRTALPRGTPVVTDVGGFRLWSMQTFEAYAPEDFVTAGSWAGMSVGLPGAIGAALARPDEPVACLTGDGGLLMCVHELHTAAEYDLDLTVVVAVDDDYGIISKSMRTEYGPEARFDWESPDFVRVAEGFGCRASGVDTETALRDAVAAAIDRDGPELIAVDVDPDQPSAPEAGRYESRIDLDRDTNRRP